MSAINYHPSAALLQSYCSADLDPATSMLINMHLEFCPHCRQHVGQLEHDLIHRWWQQITPIDDKALSALCEHIVTQPRRPQEPQSTSKALHIEGRDFPLPLVLQHHEKRIGAWQRLPGRLHRAKLLGVFEGQMSLLYMAANSRLPSHQHQGNEITLVLAGGFSDELGRYNRGDFIVKAASDHAHQPFTNHDEDCLCISLLEGPLQFDGKFSAWLNPLSQLFFR